MSAPLSETQASLARILGPLEGARVPGGCDQCEADQTVEPIEAGVWKITVHHTDDCPSYVKLRAGRAA